MPNYWVPREECIQAAEDTPEAAEVLVCRDPEVTDPSRKLVLTGGSHAEQWYPAYAAIARHQDWEIILVTKSGCQLTSNTGQHPEPRDSLPDDSCQQWNTAVVEQIAALDPDAVVTIATSTRADGESAPQGFIDQWHSLDAHGVQVIAMRDNPRMPYRVPDCLLEGREPGECSQSREAIMQSQFPFADPSLAAQVPDSVVFVDLIDHLCDEQTCHAVVGDVVTYYDHSHLSATFVTSLAPALDEELRQARPDLYQD